MGPVISVDLACKSYDDLGIALLDDKGTSIHLELIKARSLNLEGGPNPKFLATVLMQLCRKRGVHFLLLDGPQAWKDPDNGLKFSRLCERLLNTPAKTGLPGQVKPATYLEFIDFSIQVFHFLQQMGAQLLMTKEDMPGPDILVLESFPWAAWKGVGVKPLPSKRKAQTEDIFLRLRQLKELFPLSLTDHPTHDELQAVVAGLGGIAFQKGTSQEYDVVGAPPIRVKEILREGFIIIPQKKS